MTNTVAHWVPKLSYFKWCHRLWRCFKKQKTKQEWCSKTLHPPLLTALWCCAALNTSTSTPSHVEAVVHWSPECHQFNLSAFQPSAYILDIGDLNAQCPTLALCLCVCVSECLCSTSLFWAANTGGSRKREREREQMKVCQLKCLPILFLFTCCWVEEKERGGDRKEDGRNVTKTCSETYRENRSDGEGTQMKSQQRDKRWMDGERDGEERRAVRKRLK